MKGFFHRRKLIHVEIILLILLTAFSVSIKIVQANARDDNPNSPYGGYNDSISSNDETANYRDKNQDLGHQVLPENDGWAAANGGTTGGSTADKAHTYVVSTRAELVAALGGDNKGADSTPKIIYIKGTIDGNVDDNNNPLACSAYVQGDYSLAAYLAAYDPAVWGRTKVPSGDQETQRHASEEAQGLRVRIYIPSNTTIVGDPQTGGRVLGATFMVNNVNNVIIRNLSFENAYDCFPQWDPTDGSTGNWNSAFQNLSILYNATHVWVDHNSFSDTTLPENTEPTYFGRVYEQHDEETDISKGANLVTVSWNRFADHNKTLLIGGTDSPTYDVGKLNVTVHHNEFVNVTQRLPRVRYGEVNVYDNFYDESGNSKFLYALGAGISSAIYAQNNYYKLAKGVAASSIIAVYKGTALYSTGDIVNGASVDVVAAYNTANPATPLSTNVGWTPTYQLKLDPAQIVPDLVLHFAGASRTLRVDQNGEGDFTTVQAAINDIPVYNAQNVTIHIAAGTYTEVVLIGSTQNYISLIGGTRDAKDTVIAFNNWSGTPTSGGGTLGTSGSATVTVNANDFRAEYITFANTFDPTTQPQTNQHQAVALKTAADRMIFDHDRFLGLQDTLYVNSSSTTTIGRQLYTDSYIEGNVDFIFGRGTAVFKNDQINILAASGGAPKMTAASTVLANPYGFLFDHDVVLSTVADGTAFLGRPWPSTPDASAQVTVRNTYLPAAISSSPWEDWNSTTPWTTGRYFEYQDFGPGASVNANSPQLTDDQAKSYTPYSYLVGTDDWTPDNWQFPPTPPKGGDDLTNGQPQSDPESMDEEP